MCFGLCTDQVNLRSVRCNDKDKKSNNILNYLEFVYFNSVDMLQSLLQFKLNFFPLNTFDVLLNFFCLLILSMHFAASPID